MHRLADLLLLLSALCNCTTKAERFPFDRTLYTTRTEIPQVVDQATIFYGIVQESGPDQDPSILSISFRNIYDIDFRLQKCTTHSPCYVRCVSYSLLLLVLILRYLEFFRVYPFFFILFNVT